MSFIQPQFKQFYLTTTVLYIVCYQKSKLLRTTLGLTHNFTLTCMSTFYDDCKFISRIIFTARRYA